MKVKYLIQSTLRNNRTPFKYYDLETDSNTITCEYEQNQELINLNFGNKLTIYNWHKSTHLIMWNNATEKWLDVYDWRGNNIFNYAFLQDKINEIPPSVLKFIKNKTLEQYNPASNIYIHQCMSSVIWEGNNPNFETQKWDSNQLFKSVTHSDKTMEKHGKFVEQLKIYNINAFNKLIHKLEKELIKYPHNKTFSYMMEIYSKTHHVDTKKPIISYMPTLWKIIKKELIMDVDIKLKHNSTPNMWENQLAQFTCIKHKGIGRIPSNIGSQTKKYQITNSTIQHIQRNYKKNNLSIDFHNLKLTLLPIQDATSWEKAVLQIFKCLNPTHQENIIKSLTNTDYENLPFTSVTFDTIYQHTKGKNASNVLKALQNIEKQYPIIKKVCKEFAKLRKQEFKKQV